MKVLDLILACGAQKAAEVATNTLTFSPELRTLCESNACGRYGRNYTCPPYVGEVNETIATVTTYPNAVIWQNIFTLEDSFDIEGMFEAQKTHNLQTYMISKKVYELLGRENALVLAAGGCSLCEKCAFQTSEPCRFPDDALASLEAYGMNVSQIGASTNLKYMHGQNTVTYFSGVFYR